VCGCDSYRGRRGNGVGRRKAGDRASGLEMGREGEPMRSQVTFWKIFFCLIHIICSKPNALSIEWSVALQMHVGVSRLGRAVLSGLTHQPGNGPRLNTWLCIIFWLNLFSGYSYSS